MKQILILLFAIASWQTLIAQQFHVYPERPTTDDSILFDYDSRPVFGTNDNITCVAYFTGPNERTKIRADFPIAQVVSLKKSGETWSGKIDIVPKNATALIFVFMDSLNNRDSNKGKGYFTPFYSNNQPTPGAWAGIGVLLFGNWITDKAPFHIKYDLDSARKFLMKDFVTYPEVKRQYFGSYLDLLKMRTPEEESSYRKELEELATFPDLSQVELLKLRFQYARLKDTVNANKYERQIFEKFPVGSWTVQVKSMKQLTAVASERDFGKQAKSYNNFKEAYLKSYEDEFAAITMNERAAQMLGYMAEHFVNEGTLNLWLTEVDALTEDGKRHAYRNGARNLLGMAGRPNEATPKINSTKKITTTEHIFFQNNIEEPDANVKVASDLATRAVEIAKNNFNEPRRFNEPLILTDPEVKDFRNLLMSWDLEIQGLCLLKQNKFGEAVEVLTDAVERNHFEESRVNQTYIEALVKAGQVDKALSEIEKIVALGKSTAAIDAFYAKYKKGNSNIATIKNQSIEVAKEALKNKMVKEDIADFTFFDQSGKEIKSSSLKNKIVVIDFWASWCPPCMITLEANDLVIDKYKQDSDVVFLLMGEDESKERAMNVINKHNNKSSFVFDHDRELVKKIAASLPTLIIIDKKGKIRFRTNGLTSFNVQENAIELQAIIELLKEK